MAEPMNAADLGPAHQPQRLARPPVDDHLGVGPEQVARARATPGG